VALRVACVDGTKGGWVAVELEDGCFLRARLIEPVQTDFAALEAAQVVAIDVPIGFGPRSADVAARIYLKGAASTVFSTPPREVLEVPFGPGLAVSAQAHALGPRILHVTELAARDQRIREVHPEVSFRAMNDGRALRNRKKSAGGVLERLALLSRHGVELGDLGSAASDRGLVDRVAAPVVAGRAAVRAWRAVALVRPLELGAETLHVHLPAAVAATALVALTGAFRPVLGRVEGSALVVCYAAYVAVAVSTS
jgi:hypothetical protein